MKKIVLAFALLLLAASQPALAQKKPRINHIALSVAQLERSRIFYQEVIGLDTIPEPFHDGRHVWFSVSEGAHLHLIQNPPPIEVPSKNTHLCFSVADIKAFVALLHKNRIHYEDWPGKAGAVTTRTDGIHQIYLKDPDGYWIEINDDYK
ncbi:MAG TPA: VOC family protein [Flavisolibacter sp.]|jgi:lactoylglutathione lyase|nr:VOC family protein [Flavisolibacter sp.]